MPTDKTALSVSQLARKMRNLLEIQIGECWVEGEVSNLRQQSSGHQYFTLKDDKAQLNCAFFKGRATHCKIDLKDGMKLRVFAEVSLYEARGSLQLIVVKVEAIGQGELQARFEALKMKLDAEGLFDAARKREIPSFPRRLAIVTSPTAAALQDMLNVLRRRAPWVKLYLFPVRVQGAGAENEIANALHQLSHPKRFGHPKTDIIIIGRGGGSLEDLWNFNEEVVARAIYDCPIPIISAVGHEIDFTISDFVADLRAPTPSAAAELAVPDGDALRQKLSLLGQSLKRRSRQCVERATLTLDHLSGSQMKRAVKRALDDRYQLINSLAEDSQQMIRESLTRRTESVHRLKIRLKASHPRRIQERRNEKLTALGDRLLRAASQQSTEPKRRLHAISALLRSLGPEQTLARGYSITFTAEGKILRSTEDVQPGDSIETRIHEGSLRSIVE